MYVIYPSSEVSAKSIVDAYRTYGNLDIKEYRIANMADKLQGVRKGEVLLYAQSTPEDYKKAGAIALRGKS